MKISDISYYLFESYKDAREKFSQEESEDIVKQYLDTFKQLAKKGIAKDQEKDIGYWIKQGWPSFKSFVDSKSQEKTKSEVKKSKKKDSIIAHNDNEKMIVIPLSEDASCFYGKGTQWCTSAIESINYFNLYFHINEDVLFYIFMKDTNEKYAALYKTEQNSFVFFDDQDLPIDDFDFYEGTNLDEDKLTSLYKKHKDSVKKSQDINNTNRDSQLSVVTTKPSMIQKLDNVDQEFALEATKENPEIINYIDETLINDSVRKAVLDKKPRLFRDKKELFPRDNIELVKYALDREPVLITVLDDGEITDELRQWFLDNHPDYDNFI